MAKRERSEVTEVEGTVEVEDGVVTGGTVEEKVSPSSNDTIKALMAKIDLVLEKNGELEKEISILKSDKPVDSKSESTPFNTDIMEVVREILGKGFTTEIRPINSLNFQLVIVPPIHLREHSGDTRVKVIPYLEAESIAREYALKVREFCTNWALRRGISYQEVEN